MNVVIKSYHMVTLKGRGCRLNFQAITPCDFGATTPKSRAARGELTGSAKDGVDRRLLLVG